MKQKTITESNTITGETRTRLPYTKLGEIMVKATGQKVLYDTDDLYWIGRYALDSGDINADGTTN